MNRLDNRVTRLEARDGTQDVSDRYELPKDSTAWKILENLKAEIHHQPIPYPEEERAAERESEKWLRDPNRKMADPKKDPILAKIQATVLANHGIKVGD